jgi:hypothetical protein
MNGREKTNSPSPAQHQAQRACERPDPHQLSVSLMRFSFAQMAFLLALFLALPAFAVDAPFVVQAAPVNPLGSRAAPAEKGAPAGYSVAVSTDSGKSLVTQKPNKTSVKAALEATLPDLAGYFDQRPAIGSAYQNAKDTSSGGATFSSTLDGHAVRGIISVKLQDGGAKVAIVFGRADAPKSEWEKLMAAPAQQASTTAPANAGQASGAPASNAALTEYDYPDGTGSIGLPEGWTTQAQSAAGGVAIRGPANQVIFVHNAVTVQTPDSPIVLGQQRAEAQLAEMNRSLAQRYSRLNSASETHFLTAPRSPSASSSPPRRFRRMCPTQSSPSPTTPSRKH